MTTKVGPRTGPVKGVRVLVVLGVVLVVSLIAGAYAAGQDAPPMTGRDAREFTMRAFTFSGVEAVEVTGEPRAEFVTPTTDEQGEEEVEGQRAEDQTGKQIPVWVVPATVGGQSVELYVARHGDRAVLLDDALSGGGFVLTEEQFDRLEDFRLDLAGESLREGRQAPALVAVLLIVVAALLLVFAVLRGGGRDRKDSSEVPHPDAPPAGG